MIELLIFLVVAGAFIAERGDKRQDPGLMIVGIVIMFVGMAGGLWLV